MRTRLLTHRRTAIAGAILVALLLVGLAGFGRSEPAGQASGSFCQLYPDITAMAAMLQRGLEGEARPDDLTPANYRSLTRLVWSDRVAEGGPDQLDADAVRIATAVRRAAGGEDPAPLTDPSVRRAIERVEPAAREVCDRGDA
jgi:hypothetical protein